MRISDWSSDVCSSELRYPADRWIFDFSASLAPVASSDSQYRAAQQALRDYNGRLAAGSATFDRRADNLLQTLERIAADLGSSSAILAGQMERSGWFPIDTRSDDVFYDTKGRLYGYRMLLGALGEDFDEVIQSHNLAVV